MYLCDEVKCLHPKYISDILDTNRYNINIYLKSKVNYYHK